MIARAINGLAVLGGAFLTAVLLYWVMIYGLELDGQSVFQGVLIAASLLGVAYIAAPPPHAG